VWGNIEKHVGFLWLWFGLWVYMTQLFYKEKKKVSEFDFSSSIKKDDTHKNKVKKLW